MGTVNPMQVQYLRSDSQFSHFSSLLLDITVFLSFSYMVYRIIFTSTEQETWSTL